MEFIKSRTAIFYDAEGIQITLWVHLRRRRLVEPLGSCREYRYSNKVYEGELMKACVECGKEVMNTNPDIKSCEECECEAQYEADQEYRKDSEDCEDCGAGWVYTVEREGHRVCLQCAEDYR